MPYSRKTFAIALASLVILGPAIHAAPALPEESLRPRGYYPGDPLPPHTVYFTFDDGPSDFTGELLDILKAEGVRATFFINAFDRKDPLHADRAKNYLEPYAAVLERMVAEGHCIGNHSYSHEDFARLSPDAIEWQLSTLESKLGEVLGDREPPIVLIRPPFGSPWLGGFNSAAEKRKVGSVLEKRGIVVMWTTGWDSGDSTDWAKGEWFMEKAKRYHPGGPAYEAKMKRELDRILKRADGTASGVILMHDTHPTSRDVLRILIDELKKRGYAFGTMEEYCQWRWGEGVFNAYGPAVTPRPPEAERPEMLQ